jgi:hypothetical protein
MNSKNYKNEITRIINEILKILDEVIHTINNDNMKLNKSS